MLIKYTGGRSTYEVTMNRRSIHFNKENNHTVDIRDQNFINYIFSIPNRNEFIVIENSNDNFVSKNENNVPENDNFIEKIQKKRGRPRNGGK